MHAAAALKKWPEWKDIDFQIDWFADRMKGYLDQYPLKFAVIAHNSPKAAAESRVTVYWKDVNKRKNYFEWIN